MITKRIIPCLDIKDGKCVKGVNFKNLKDAGDPVELAKLYSASGADELVFLDITATLDKRKTLIPLVEKIAQEIHIPFTVGGGIKTLDDIKAILMAGADKVSINSEAYKNPTLIKECAEYFGSQCIVVAIDAKFVDDDFYVFINAGTKNTGTKLADYAKRMEELGAGEILLTSMDADGTKEGFDIKMNELVSNLVNIPTIASGGAGANVNHFIEVFEKTNVSAALAASIFHFNELPIDVLKKAIADKGILTRI